MLPPLQARILPVTFAEELPLSAERAAIIAQHTFTNSQA